MACTYKAPNGELSKLFDKVYNGWGKPNAIKVWLTTQSESFKTWYGESSFDSNGEPTINSNNEFENEAGDTIHISEISNTDLNDFDINEYSDQINKLTNLFESKGLNIEIELDNNSDSIGSVVTINGITKVSFNPRLLKKDTIFHEFGHIYIDMLGINNPIVRKGVEQLKDSELWNSIEKLYPELRGEKLEKEVLTTAIGLEAASNYDERIKLRYNRNESILNNLKKFKTWVNHLFSVISNKLGITENVAKKLAYDLTGSNLRYTLTHKPATYVQKMKSNPNISNLKIESTRLKLTEDEQHYMIDNDPNRLLRRATTAIEDIKGQFDRESKIKQIAASEKPEYVDYKTEDDVARLWADKREEGTGLHLINEMYIEQRGNDGSNDVSKEDAINYILDNLHKPESGVDEHGIRFYSGMSRELVSNYIENIANLIEEFYDKGYKLYPEIKVFDEEMGVAGTIDLLVEKPNGTWMIYDFKTKEVGKFDSFYTVYGKSGFTGMEGIASDVANSTANGYALQLSTYALILKRKGFNVTKLGIIPFEGDIVQTEDEYRYSDVDLFTNSNTLRDEDNVLVVKDLTETMENVYAVKLDIEQAIQSTNEGSDSISNSLEELNQLRETRKWLDELVISIKKSISRLRATADPDTATKYEREISKLVDKLLVEDEMQAITAYTEYITRGLSSLESRFYDKFELRNDPNLGQYREYIRGYDSYTWQDISELEKNNPADYMEFLGFLINADMFLGQVVKIKELPFSSSSQTNLVLKNLKEHEYKVSNLKNKINRLNRELDMRYNELSSNPLYGGRGVLHNTEMFFKAQHDESFMQRHMDALADTHNSYMANVMRLYDYKMRYMQDEVNEITVKWEEEVSKLEESGSSVSKFIDKNTAKVISPIDYSAFYKARNEMFKSVDKTYKNRNINWRTAVNKWFVQNTVRISKEEETALRNKMKKELGEEGYKDWLSRQVYGKPGRRKFKRTSPFFKPKMEIYGNETYMSLNEKELEFYKFLTSTLSYLTEHVKSSIVKEGFIPAIPINNKSATDQIVNGLGWRKGNNTQSKVVTNDIGEIVEFLPFDYNNMLAKGDYKVASKYDDEATKRKIAEHNKKEKERVKKEHAASVNQNLVDTMPIFIREAIKHKHKKAMEFELLRVRKSFMTNHKIKLSKNGKPIIDRYKDMSGLIDNSVEKTTTDSKVLAHYEDWLRMIFYEQFENDEGNLQKIARVIQNYTSFKGMAFNILSSINNQVYGSIQSNIEAAAGQFFSTGDWFKASGEYWHGAKSYMYDEENSPSTKQSAFIQYFSIMMDFKEQALGNENLNLANRALQKASWVANKAYMFEHMSEHYLQNKVLFAMAFSHRLVDGKLVTFEDYKRENLGRIITRELSIEDTKKQIKINKEKEKKLKEKFNKAPQLYELFEFKNGKLIPNDKLSKEEIAEFERRVLGVNQYLHGIYNKEDAGTMQQYALGRLAIQFRKWMRPGWTKRFGNRFGEEYWNERRSVKEQGIYVTTARFLATPVLDGWSEYIDKKGTKEAIGIGKFLTDLTKDYAKFLTNIKVHWHTLSSSEQAAVKRTFLEYATFCAAIGLLYVAKSIKGDDDDPPMALMLTIYQLDRTVTEMTTYIPLAVAPGDVFGLTENGSPIFVGGGWFNESKKLLKSPTATFSTLEAIIKLGKNIIAYPFVDEEEMIYQSGVYSGQNKINVQMKKLIPMWNQYERLKHLPQNYKYYKLF